MRRTPYTATGIKRMTCFKCENTGHAQWQICCDGNHYRVLCKEHDIELNELVARWAFTPLVAQHVIEVYRQKVNACHTTS